MLQKPPLEGPWDLVMHAWQRCPHPGAQRVNRPPYSMRCTLAAAGLRRRGGPVKPAVNPRCFAEMFVFQNTRRDGPPTLPTTSFPRSFSGSPVPRPALSLLGGPSAAAAAFTAAPAPPATAAAAPASVGAPGCVPLLLPAGAIVARAAARAALARGVRPRKCRTAFCA